MRYTQDVGVVASTGDTFKPEKIEMMFVAGGAITVGKGVMLNTSTSYPFGASVLSATSTDDHTVIGVYEGQSEKRGAVTSVSGLSGYDAVSGETVFVTVYGPAAALCYQSGTVAIAATDHLGYDATDGVLRGPVTDPGAGVYSNCWALEANTGTATTGTATDVFVRFL